MCSSVKEYMLDEDIHENVLSLERAVVEMHENMEQLKDEIQQEMTTVHQKIDKMMELMLASSGDAALAPVAMHANAAVPKHRHESMHFSGFNVMRPHGHAVEHGIDIQHSPHLHHAAQPMAEVVSQNPMRQVQTAEKAEEKVNSATASTPLIAQLST